MLKKHLILISFISVQFNLFSTQDLLEKTSPVSSSSTSQDDLLNCLSVGTSAVAFIRFLQEQILPTEFQKAKKELQIKQINALSTEASFRRCLVRNAFKSRAESGLPINCQLEAGAFVRAHDIEKLAAVRDEFVAVTSEFDEHGQLLPVGWSLNKKIAAGVAILVTVGAGAIALAPILFPGTEVAKQAQKIINKAEVLGRSLNAGVKLEVAKKAAELNADKLAATEAGVKWTSIACKLGYKSPEEKLATLRADKAVRPGLKAQIMQAYKQS